MNPDSQYENIPWRDGGNDHFGADCRGLVLLWLREQAGFTAPLPKTHAEEDADADAKIRAALQQKPMSMWVRGDVIFFEHAKKKKIRHVAVHLGGGKLLEAFKDSGSRIVNGPALILRQGYRIAGVLDVKQSEALAGALANPRLGDPISPWVMLALSIVLSVASAFLMPKPKLGAFRNQSGTYGFDNLITQQNPQIPVPDILGAVTVAGNSPYQSIADKSQTITDGTQQRVNKLVVLASGPITDVEYNSSVMKVNGRAFDDTYWHAGGIARDPAQTKAEAVDGTIGSYLNQPSVSVYLGTHAIEVPKDVRAQYDRNFPLHGMSGCGYVVFRLMDSTKFDRFNLTVTVKGRKVRTYDEDGFIVTTVTDEDLPGADGSKVRFKLDFEDIKDITDVDVDGDTFTALAAGNQSGDVYHVNKTKGYIEFITAPTAAAVITVSYTYYPREWTQNPTNQSVYLLTERGRGKGAPEAKVNWPAAVEERDYCDETLIWNSGDGVSAVEARHTSDYSVDVRRPIQEHIRAVRDACYGYLFSSGGKFTLRPRKAGSSVYSFTTDNILKDSFSSEDLDRSGLANSVQVYFHPLETFSAETSITRVDDEDQALRAESTGDDGEVPEVVRMLAVARASHAERLGETMLRENVQARRVCQLTTTIKGLALEPGDLVDVTHPARPDWSAKVMRIEDLSHDEQDRLVLKLSEYFAGAYF